MTQNCFQHLSRQKYDNYKNILQECWCDKNKQKLVFNVGQPSGYSFTNWFPVFKICFIAASLGGIFGLCLGGSVLSIAEVLYILSANLFRKKKRKPPCEVTIYLNELLKNNHVSLNKPRILDVSALSNNQAKGKKLKEARLKKH